MALDHVDVDYYEWPWGAVLVLQAFTCVALCSCAFAQLRDRATDWGKDTLRIAMSAFAGFVNRLFD
jgi:hypothetical protein